MAAVSLVWGCGGPLEQQEANPASQPGQASQPSQASQHSMVSFTYHCTADHAAPTPELWLKATGALADISASADWSNTATGQFDETYQPRAHGSMARFTGFADWSRTSTTALYLETALRNGGEPLPDGSRGGSLSIEYTGNTDSSDAYTCQRLGLASHRPPLVGGMLSPFALQFVGQYNGTGTTVSSVTLKPDGTYEATVHKGQLETGTFTADPNNSRVLPMEITLTSADGSWTATVDEYDSKLHVKNSGHKAALTATDKVGPDESDCDTSGGAWTDDEPDARTGLFCVCPAGHAYIPSAGGCVK